MSQLILQALMILFFHKIRPKQCSKSENFVKYMWDFGEHKHWIGYQCQLLCEFQYHGKISYWCITSGNYPNLTTTQYL